MKVVIRFISVLVLLFVVVSSLAMAQLEYANWVYGKGLNVSFTSMGLVKGGPEVKPKFSETTDHWLASYSDKCSGELLWYTDGKTIKDRKGRTLPNGTNLHDGIPSGQTALIIADPGNDDRFYIFSCISSAPGNNEKSSRYTYSVISRKANDGYGDVIEKNVSFGPAVGGMSLTATHNAEGTGYWLAVSNNTTALIEVYEITADGISENPVQSDLASAGHTMKFSPDGKYLVTLGGVVFDFDNRTGTLQFAMSLQYPPEILDEQEQHRQDLAAVLGGWGWQTGSFAWQGVSFSPSSNCLYLSGSFYSIQYGTHDGKIYVTPNYGYVYQYNLQDVDRLTGKGGRARLHKFKETPRTEMKTLQLAPDGKVYCSDPNGMYVVHLPDIIGDGCAFSEAFTYPYAQSTGLLPSCIESSYFRGPITPCLTTSIADDTICVGACTNIRVHISSMYDSVSCAPKLGVSYSRGVDPTEIVVCADKPGTYDIVVRMYIRDAVIPDTVHVVVAVPPIVSAGPDIALCGRDSTKLYARGAATYVWSPIDGLDDPMVASPMLRGIRERRMYIVTGTDSRGCVDVDTVIVNVDEVHATINPDTVICSGQEVRLVVGGGPVRWVSGAASDAGHDILVKPSITTTYRAIVGQSPCIDTAMCTVTVLPSPGLIVSNDTTICSGTSIELQAKSDVDVFWESSEVIVNPTSKNISVHPATTAWYTVTTQSSGCNVRDSVLVTVVEGSVKAMAYTTICLGRSVVLMYAGAPGAQWYSQADGSFVGTGSPLVTPQYTTVYKVVRTIGACEFSDTVTISVGTERLADISTTICEGERATLQPDQPADLNDIEWYTTNGDRIGTGHTLIVQPAGTTSYMLCGVTSLGCEVQGTATVAVVPRAEMSFELPHLRAFAGKPVEVPLLIRSTLETSRNVDFFISIEPPVVILDHPAFSLDVQPGDTLIKLVGVGSVTHTDARLRTGDVVVAVRMDDSTCLDMKFEPGYVVLSRPPIPFAITVRTIFPGGLEAMIEQEHGEESTVTAWSILGQKLSSKTVQGSATLVFDDVLDNRIFLMVQREGEMRMLPLYLEKGQGMP